MNALYESLRQHALDLFSAGALPQPFAYGFVVNAILCGILIGPLLGGIGTMVVVKRMAFFSQAVGNSAMTGVAIGVLLGEPVQHPYFAMFGFCILFGLVLNYTRNRTKMSPDTLIGVFLAVSLALGSSLLLFVSAKVNTHILEAVLFGSILTVGDTDINVLLAVCVLCALVAVPLFNPMLLASLNPSLAAARGVRVRLLEYVFIVLITILTVACVKIIGAVLVEALLLIPAAAARNLVTSVRGFVAWSIGFSTVSCLAGIYIPMQWDLALPSGGAIVLVATTFFVITTIIRSTFGRFREART
jgi:zinc transport system permease protein